MIKDYEDMSRVLTEMASILKPRQVEGLSERNLWLIDINDDTVLFAELSEERQIVVLSCPVTVPLLEGRESSYERMIKYGYEHRLTGGLYFSLDGDGGFATLMLDVATTVITPEKLAIIMKNMAEIAATWRDDLSTPIIPTTGTEENFVIDETFIRV